MKPGWDPRKKNRNIGTSKRGYGSDNKMVVPCSSNYGSYWDSLGFYQTVERTVKGKYFKIVIEETSPGFVHAVTPDDIAMFLNFMDFNAISLIDFVVLRQPTKKQRILKSVWGRWYSTGIRGNFGNVICLEAVNLSEPLEWSKKLSVDGKQELARLRKDGHRVIEDKRVYRIQMTLESARATQLYRTLPHEIGHAIDFKATGSEEQSPVQISDDEGPNLDDMSFDDYIAELENHLDRISRIIELTKTPWDSKPSKEKEDFAHRYAEDLKEKLVSRKLVPFERQFNKKSLLENDHLSNKIIAGFSSEE